MDELAGGRRRADPPPSSSPLQLPPDDLLMETLLRLPPEPIHLFRASFVSKHWRSLVQDARFRCRFREFHGGTPPVFGFFNSRPWTALFVPTSGGSALSSTTMSHIDWWSHDCRHGRALLHNYLTGTLLVWDPMTGDKRYLPFPTQAHPENVQYNGAVLSAAGHTDHGDCHSCPFLVAFAFSNCRDFIASACVYSSETGVWGFASVNRFNLHFWSRVASIDGVVSWTHNRVIDLEKCQVRLLLLAPEVVAACMNQVWPVGYAEDANVIFIGVYPRTYMIHLKSMQIEEVSRKQTSWFIFPYTSFYTPGPGITTGDGDDQAEPLNGS